MTFEKEFNDRMTRLNKNEKPEETTSAFNFELLETTEDYIIYLAGAKEYNEG